MFKLPELSYGYSELEPYVDKATMELHHSKHHAAYVANLNDAVSTVPALALLTDSDLIHLIKSLDTVPENIRSKVANNAGGHFNHSLYWSTMSPEPYQPEGQFLEALNSTFSSVDSFKQQLKAKALARFGSGWAWLVLDEGKLDIVDTANQDSPLSHGQIPLLGVDVWEHAYYLKYNNRRGEYVDAWFNLISWRKVESFFEQRSVVL